MKKAKKIIPAIVLAFLLAFMPSALMFTPSANAASDRWVSAWGTSPVNGSVSVSFISLQDIIPAHSTIRTELTVTTGGTKLKFHFSNQYGDSAISIAEAGVARTNTEATAKIVNGTQTIITFNGNRNVTIPAGKDVWSDEITFSTQAMDKLSVSLYFDKLTYITTTGLSNGRTYLGNLNLISSTTPSKVDYLSLGTTNEINISSGTITYHTIPFLCDVTTCSNQSNPSTAVFIGDSTLVNDSYLYYAQKIINAGKNNVGIINEAIVANKLLSNGTGLIGNLYGDAMIDRFKRDVLQKPNVKYVFVKIGLNDILHQFSKSMTDDVPHYTADDIIAGYKSLITMAHNNNIKIYFFTKSAWKGYERSFLGQTGDLTWSQEAQDMCDQLDAWIKSNNEADGFIDCSPLADPSDPTKLCSTLTIDGAHLTTLGAIGLADLIPTEFLGVAGEGIKTAAELNGVDPYTEKNQILADMSNPSEKQEATTTADNTQNNTTPVNEPTTQKSAAEVTTDDKQEATTAVPAAAPVTEEPSTFNYTEPTTVNDTVGSVTVAADSSTGSTQKIASNKNISYQTQDIELDTTRSNTSLIYIFVLFSAVTVAAVLVILTIGRRKEAEI